MQDGISVPMLTKFHGNFIARERYHEIHIVYLSWDVSWGHFKIHGKIIDVSGPRSLVVIGNQPLEIHRNDAFVHGPCLFALFALRIY